MAQPGRACSTVLQRVLLLICLCAAGPCMAVRHALLVGVSQYPGLPPELHLKAPANDVRLMRQVLLQRGFDAARIEVLADGVAGAGLPTQAAIVAALQGLAVRARDGDTVYMHFSGHGSLQWAEAAGADLAQPVRQWQPVFMPRDVQGWDGKIGAPVPQAMADTLLRRLVDRINDTGAFVFVLFDACHSAKLVRGALPGTDAAQLRVRHVPPAALGLPGDPPPEVWPEWVLRPVATTRQDLVPDRRGRAVYFYAAQSVELAASLPLSNGGEPVWHGLFTWHVAQALSLGQTMTYRQLGQHVLSRYDQLPAATATPLFSGDGLDQAVFGQQAAVHRQWPVERWQGRITLPAGALAGLAEGALLAVLADPLAPAPASAANGPAPPPQGTLGFVRVVTVEANRALLEPVAWQGWAAPSVQTLPAGSWARLMINPPAFALRVSINRSACRADCVAGRALAQLQRDGVPGVDVRWVGIDDNPDARLQASESGVRLLLPGMAESGQASWGFAAPSGDESIALEVLTQQTAGALHRVARTRNLLRLAAAMALRAPFADVQLTLKLRRRGADTDVPVALEQLFVVKPGDLLLLDARNRGGDPVDLSAFWLGADHSIRQVYPQDSRESPRLPAGARLRRLGLGIDPGSDGAERLLVLMVPMRQGQDVSDFRFLEQSPLSRLRGAGDPVLQALLDACFADYALRGDAAPALPAERLGLQLFTFQVRP